MRVLLAYPPSFAPPSMPFGALPLLNACMKRAGHETSVIDVNAEAFTVMSRREVLRHYFEVLDRNGRSAAAKLDVFPRNLLLEAQDAAAALRDRAVYYDPARFRRLIRIIHLTHAFLHAATPSLDPRNRSYTPKLFEQLLEDAPDCYDFVYESDTVPRIAALRPRLVAFSSPFSPQIATAMRLARKLRAALPDTVFVMGGTGISDAAHVLLPDPRFYDFVDYAIVGDGEESLPALAEALETGVPPSSVPGLWRREGTTVIPPAGPAMADMDRSPSPDFAEVDFSHYMLPEPAAIYTTSRGCYYGKCTFCPEGFRKGFRMRSPENVYADVRNLVVEQGIEHIHFLDPLTPPRTLVHVSREVAREKLPLKWYGEVKFERIYMSRDYVRTLKAGGCKILQFGLESGVQRVLDVMDKGNKLDQIEVMLANLKEHGIACAVTWFIGFPNESEEDAKETWRFIRRHPSEIHLSMYTGTFGLGEDVPVFQHPEEYDIQIRFDASGNPVYVRNDGLDWDQTPLHEAFYARSDLQLAINGASLLYSAKDPSGLLEIRGANAVGPAAFEIPIEARTVQVSDENNVVEEERDPDGTRRFRVLVGQTGESFAADALDILVVDLVRKNAGVLRKVLAEGAAIPDLATRLARWIDRGLFESRDVAASIREEERGPAVASAAGADDGRRLFRPRDACARPD